MAQPPAAFPLSLHPALSIGTVFGSWSEYCEASDLVRIKGKNPYQYGTLPECNPVNINMAILPGFSKRKAVGKDVQNSNLLDRDLPQKKTVVIHIHNVRILHVLHVTEMLNQILPTDFERALHHKQAPVSKGEGLHVFKPRPCLPSSQQHSGKHQMIVRSLEYNPEECTHRSEILAGFDGLVQIPA